VAFGRSVDRSKSEERRERRRERRLARLVAAAANRQAPNIPSGCRYGINPAASSEGAIAFASRDTWTEPPSVPAIVASDLRAPVTWEIRCSALQSIEADIFWCAESSLALMLARRSPLSWMEAASVDSRALRIYNPRNLFRRIPRDLLDLGFLLGCCEAFFERK